MLLLGEFKDNTNKIVWIIIILVLYPIGWILYLIFGRKQKSKKGKILKNKLINLLFLTALSITFIGCITTPKMIL